MDPRYDERVQRLANSLGMRVEEVVDQLIDFAVANRNAVFDWRPALAVQEPQSAPEFGTAK